MSIFEEVRRGEERRGEERRGEERRGEERRGEVVNDMTGDKNARSGDEQERERITQKH